MSEYFGQKLYQEIMGIDGKYTIAEEGSFLVAQCNLLKNFGTNISPPKLNEFYDGKGTYVRINSPIRDDLYWDSLLEFDKSLVIVGMDSGWPSTNLAIVKFQYQSVQEPYIDKDGEPTPNIIRHFCVMADYTKNLIIDSYDGEVKEAGVYGIPVSYTIYGKKTKQQKKEKSQPFNKTYTILQGGESAWEVARKLKTPPIELIEHNDLEDPEHIPAGYQLRLPYPIPVTKKTEISYEVFDSPRFMHISAKGGTRKFSFGNVKKWADLSFTGPLHKEGANLNIIAIAHVPVGDEVASYYMEPSALGDFYNTGRVSMTVGFNHTHLKDGLIEEKPIEIQPIVTERLMEVAEEALATLEPVVPMEVEQPIDYDDWKTTYLPFEGGNRVYILRRNYSVRNYENLDEREYYFQHDEIELTGTFVGEDGMKYGRLIRGENHFHWKCIPMSKEILQPYAEVYNTKLEPIERIAAVQNKVIRQPLSPPEKTFEVFARNVTELRRLKVGYDKFRHKK